MLESAIFGSHKHYTIDIRRLITSAVTVDGKAAANFRFQSGLSSSQLEGRIQQILTFMAFALAAILIATGEIGIREHATPAITLAMRMVGISTLTWSSTSYAVGKCKRNEKCHRGSIQAQGRNIQGSGKGNSRTKSAPWAQPTPLTLAQGLSKLEELKSMGSQVNGVTSQWGHPKSMGS